MTVYTKVEFLMMKKTWDTATANKHNQQLKKSENTFYLTSCIRNVNYCARGMPVFYRLFNRYLGDYLLQQLFFKMQIKWNVSTAKQVKANVKNDKISR